MRTVDRLGITRIDALTELTGVSAVTIRRDLVELEQAGFLARTHGGARRVPKRGTPQPFAVRQAEDRADKIILAQATAQLIADDEAVIIDNGTTYQAVAQELAGRPITALCLSLHSAAALGSRAGTNIFIPGGPVENDSLALSGPAVISAVRDFSADAVNLGSCSTSLSHGLATTTYDDAENKRAAINAATRRILVVAARKLDHVSTFRFADVSDLHQLVTTSDAPREILAEIRDLGVQVITVPAPDQ
nr:DeoR/GlpR family DNA-binding transcription regulator [Corynebacterium glutamicum]